LKPEASPARPEGLTNLPATDPLAGFPGLLDCVHCGLCLQACPTYRISGIESDSPRGRITLMRAQAEGRAQSDEVAAWVDRCVMCRACEPVCPSQVQYHELAVRQRAGQRTAGSTNFLERYAASPFRQRWLGRAARWARRLGILGLVERAGPRRLRTLAQAVPARPSSWRPPPGSRFAAQGEQRGKVALHLGCVNPEFFGTVLRDTVAVLTQQGFEVHVPEHPSCCGALTAHAGDPAAGGAAASATLRALADADAVIVPAAGCAAHLREADPRSPVSDPLMFLAAHGLRGALRAQSKTVVHAPPCHLQNVLRGTGAVDQLLAQLPGVELRVLEEAQLCCGAGGATFAEQPEISSELGQRKAAAIDRSGAAFVVTGNPGCLLQIEAALRAGGHRARVLHPVSLLREALERES
jgi:glycolate oxidase iron-sulfur subunit